MPQRRSFADKTRYFNLLNEGMSNPEACRSIGIATKTGLAWKKDQKDAGGTTFHERQRIAKIKGPIPYELLKGDALRAYNDFEFFRRAHFGRVSSPWQIDAGYKFVEAAKSPEKSYLILNCPPGGGKSTLLHDVEVWMTVRNRGIRGMVGSVTQRLANRYNGRIRRSLERPKAPQVDPTEVAAGRAVDPIASLVQWYGRFQPDMQDLWRMEEFIVAQIGDIAIGEKEPTWQAYGLDTEYLGNRVDIAVWDDATTMRTMGTEDAITKQRNTWDNEAENRLEPGGVLGLVGQRLGPLDLYKYNKDKLSGDFAGLSEDDLFNEMGMQEINAEGSKIPRMYTSIVYKAHDEEKCVGLHSTTEPRFWSPDDNEACLLDPIRLSYKELNQKKLRSDENYRTVYQQEDVDPANVLVPREYVKGGMYEGEELPGCYDVDRAYHEVPHALDSGAYSIVTVDPSPTKFWSIQWWLYEEKSECRYLMDLVRKKLSADQVLDEDPRTHVFTGVLEDLWQLSNSKGRPFRNLIIERNGAQRFLLQLSYFQRWCQLRGVSVYPHDTSANKSDPLYGVQVLTAQYRHGRVRLPNSPKRGDLGFAITRQLVDEVTVWPNGITDDCVMAQWFLEWWIPRLVTPHIEGIEKAQRPSWLRRVS